MEKGKFLIKILDLYWLNGEKDDPDDLCLHGDVSVKIGEEVVADSYSCTVSSTAIYLLKSIEEDHILEESSNQMLPCCGFFVIPHDTEDTVEICGCPNGIDWSVLHRNGKVKLITEKGHEVEIELNAYKKVVFDFVDEIKSFYDKCSPKNIPTEEFDYNGYIKFWKEWSGRRSR
ncbi:hypothetical protein [Hathewaya massiliensis]|uniref:hypothetical protein n=1 Tax=Hathewaya massiliensis TaxID=1964382 RepID=UPI001FA969B8|nr:hypothetical protein [Hathewaya massiliensis]